MERSVEPSNLQAAIAFVEELDLPPFGKLRSAKKAVRDPIAENRDQALVVGADIVSFVSGVNPQLRTPIIHCALLAQLAANRKVPSREDVREWYKAYFDVLEHLGWGIQDRGFSDHIEKGDDFEAHQAILAVASTVLGPAPAALEIVKSTLTAMKASAKGSWMTIFQQESQAAKAARFQVTVAEPANRDGVVVSLMAFELNATTSLTQVLFFKLRSMDVRLRHSSGRIVIDGPLLGAIGPSIARRVSDYVQNYVENIPI